MSDDNFSMMELFRQEVETQGMALGQGLIDLEGDPANAATMQSLMRAAHSIKGAARIVGVGVAADVAHDLEDCFIAAQEGRIQLSAESIDCFLATADLLSEISRLEEDQIETWAVANADRIDPLRVNLKAIASGSASTESAPATESDLIGDASADTDSASGTTEPAADGAVVEAAAAVSIPPVGGDAVNGGKKSSGSPSGSGEAGVNSQAATVRVAAESLNRLMGLTAEGLVETRRLGAFREALLRVKTAQLELSAGVENLESTLNPSTCDPELVVRLGETRQTSQQIAASVRALLEEFDSYSRRNSLLSDRLYREVLAGRMRPFADGATGFPRLVRDLARTLGKQIRFQLEGGRTPVDRDILDKLEAPLTHIVRNACDHGLETADERQAAGKERGGG